MSAWSYIILAASRGAADPMAQAYGTEHKCLIRIGNIPMLSRVQNALDQAHAFQSKIIVIEPSVELPTPHMQKITPEKSAASSARAAVQSIGRYPILITTGDHALLTPEMVRYVLENSQALNADVTVSLARAETILAAYPETKRTFFKLGPDRISGCNIFTVHNANALALFDTWEKVERLRKKPWKLVAEFGFWPLLKFITGQLDLTKALDFVSQKTGAKVQALLLPFAEAAIDVDKPADKELAEKIISARSNPA